MRRFMTLQRLMYGLLISLRFLWRWSRRCRAQPLTVELLQEAKRIEFPDNVIARLTGRTEQEIREMRYDNGIVAAL